MCRSDKLRAGREQSQPENDIGTVSREETGGPRGGTGGHRAIRALSLATPQRTPRDRADVSQLHPRAACSAGAASPRGTRVCFSFWDSTPPGRPRREVAPPPAAGVRRTGSGNPGLLPAPSASVQPHRERPCPHALTP